MHAIVLTYSFILLTVISKFILCYKNKEDIDKVLQVSLNKLRFNLIIHFATHNRKSIYPAKNAGFIVGSTETQRYTSYLRQGQIILAELHSSVQPV